MPIIGELRHGKEIGYKTNACYIWAICEVCGQARWVQTKYINPRCHKCSWVGRHHSIETKIRMSQQRKGTNAGAYTHGN